MEDKYDIVIAGSGISGMSLAYYCAKDDMKVLVLEQNELLGGCFTTKYADDYWLELGAHTMYNSYGNFIDIVEGCNLSKDIIKRKKVPYKVLNSGKIRSVVSQFSIPELLFSFPSIFRMKKENQTVESYYSRIVGRKNYQKFFQYMFNAVPSQPTNNFPANILFKKRTRRKDVLKSFTFRQGIKSIIDAIGDQPGISTLTASPVSSVERIGDTFQVTTANNNTLKADYLALATPVNATASLIKEINGRIAELTGKIEFVMTDSVGVVIRKENVQMKEFAGLIGINEDFYSVVSRDVVEDKDYRGFIFHFKPGSMDDSAKTNFICSTLGISKESIERSFSIQNTVPSFKLKHDLIVNEIDKILEKEERVFITGNYFSGMAIEDCVDRSRQEFERLKKMRK